MVCYLKTLDIIQPLVKSTDATITMKPSSLNQKESLPERFYIQIKVDSFLIVNKTLSD